MKGDVFVKRLFFCVCLCLVFSHVVLVGSIVQAWPTQEGRLIMCDVGQGDAFIVQKGFFSMLVDAGLPNNQAVACAKRNLPWFDSRLDIFVATHPDLDHIGGAEAVFNQFSVTQMMLTIDAKKGTEFKRFRELVLTKVSDGTQLLFPRSGDQGKFSRSVWFQVVAPLESYDLPNVYNSELTETTLSAYLDEHVSKIKNYNDRSIAFFLDIDDMVIFFTGDIEKETEKALASNNLLHKVDILKVSHHGSKTSSISDVLQQVLPEVALISVGKNNRFKHPASEVLERLYSSNALIFRSDIEGEVEISLTREGIDILKNTR